jgi:hypothetical protein
MILFPAFDSPRIFASLLEEDNVHILATTDGIPVEFTFLSGSNVSICLILM